MNSNWILQKILVYSILNFSRKHLDFNGNYKKKNFFTMQVLDHKQRVRKLHDNVGLAKHRCAGRI